eukprot:6942585-Ditylum_brightwellii.AAC.1
MMGFDLHEQSCKNRHKRDIQAIAFVLDPAESRSTKGKLYRLNNVTAAEQAKWSHTGHWKFAPFITKGNITDTHIWFLTTKTTNESTKLFTLVDVDPNNIYCICTDQVNKEEATEWLDKLLKLLCNTFTFDQLCEICENDDEDLLHSYCEVLAENTLDAVSRFDKILRGVMDIANNDDPVESPEVEEDHLCSCWKSFPAPSIPNFPHLKQSHPPPQHQHLVVSQTAIQQAL